MSNPAPADVLGLRERKKDATRRALSEAALRMAVARGYEHVTVSDITEAVGVSRRTFSNYFAGKADCLVAVAEGWTDDVLDAVRSAPRALDPAVMLQSALLDVAQQVNERWGALSAVLATEPDLQARMLAGDAALVPRIAAEIAQRTSLQVADIRVQLLADFAITAGRTCIARWVAGGRRGGAPALGALLARAFSIIDLSGLTPGS